jgi:hypothetical protein
MKTDQSWAQARAKVENLSDADLRTVDSLTKMQAMMDMINGSMEFPEMVEMMAEELRLARERWIESRAVGIQPEDLDMPGWYRVQEDALRECAVKMRRVTDASGIFASIGDPVPAGSLSRD